MSAQRAMGIVWAWTATTEMLLTPCSTLEAGVALATETTYMTGWSSQRKTKTTIYQAANVHGILREAGGTTDVIWPASAATVPTTHGIRLQSLLCILTTVAWWLSHSRDRHCCESQTRTALRECCSSKYKCKKTYSLKHCVTATRPNPHN